jgi:hypothetical protein
VAKPLDKAMAKADGVCKVTEHKEEDTQHEDTKDDPTSNDEHEFAA